MQGRGANTQMWKNRGTDVTLLREVDMPKSTEPTNLVLEQLRLMRAETSARFDQLLSDNNGRFDRLEKELSDLRKDVRGLKLNTIAEIYKANLTVASFADLERRVAALEAKIP